MMAKIQDAGSTIKKRALMITSNVRAAYSNDEKSICIYWWYKDDKNWGDKINPLLAKLLSGRSPITMTENTKNPRRRPVYAIIGSILQDVIMPRSLYKDMIIWGPGCISSRDKLPGSPREICAVRGPLTRDVLLKQGIKCPEVYGDPVLLYPRFYRPEIVSKYRLGIIPHYVDRNNEVLNKFRGIDDVKIIDINGKINHVVDQICSCRRIASSSLHGLIAADAYGVPSTWIKLSDGVIGDGFKFRDYFASIGRLHEEPLIITPETTLDDVHGAFHTYKVDINIKQLIDACPFYKK
jgi:pyruvyltransferase